MSKKIVRTIILYILLLSVILLVSQIYAGCYALIPLLAWFVSGLFILCCFLRLQVLYLWKGKDKAPATLILVHSLALVAWFLIGLIPS